MTKLQAIRQFADTVLGEKVVIARRRSEWGMDIQDTYPRLLLPQDLQQNDSQDKLFRKDFISRYKGGRGFANVTLSILHEIGHWFTRFEIDWIEYFILQDQVSGIDYFALEAEQKATNWAINWLSDPEHRKIAKAFEINYFGH